MYANDNFLGFFSLTKEDIVGNHIIDIRCAGIRNITLPAIFSDLIVDPKVITEVNLEMDTGNFWFRNKSMRIVFDDGKKGVMIFLENITKEKEFRVVQMATEARYRGIVEDQTEFITRFSNDGALTFANESYSRYLGKKPEELVGTYHIPVIFAHENTVLETAIKSLDRDRPFASVECRIQDRSGRICWNAWTLRALLNEDESIREYQGIGRDITEQKESAEKLKEHANRMEFFSRKLQEFVELPSDADIFHAIGSGLLELDPRFGSCGDHV